jgi:hypothetical protein
MSRHALGYLGIMAFSGSEGSKAKLSSGSEGSKARSLCGPGKFGEIPKRFVFFLVVAGHNVSCHKVTGRF